MKAHRNNITPPMKRPRGKLSAHTHYRVDQLRAAGCRRYAAKFARAPNPNTTPRRARNMKDTTRHRVVSRWNRARSCFRKEQAAENLATRHCSSLASGRVEIGYSAHAHVLNQKLLRTVQRFWAQEATGAHFAWEDLSLALEQPGLRREQCILQPVYRPTPTTPGKCLPLLARTLLTAGGVDEVLTLVRQRLGLPADTPWEHLECLRNRNNTDELLRSAPQIWHRDRCYKDPPEDGRLVVVHILLQGPAYYLDLLPRSHLQGEPMPPLGVHRVSPGLGGLIAHHVNTVHRGMECSLQPGESIYRMYVTFAVNAAPAAANRHNLRRRPNRPGRRGSRVAVHALDEGFRTGNLFAELRIDSSVRLVKPETFDCARKPITDEDVVQFNLI